MKRLVGGTRETLEQANKDMTTSSLDASFLLINQPVPEEEYLADTEGRKLLKQKPIKSIMTSRFKNPYLTSGDQEGWGRLLMYLGENQDDGHCQCFYCNSIATKCGMIGPNEDISNWGAVIEQEAFKNS